MTQPSPISLDLAQRVWDTYDNFGRNPVTALQDALVEHLPEIAACHRHEVDVAVIEHALADMPDFMNYRDRANHIAAALSDAANGGHWERYDGPTEDGGLYRQEWQQDKSTVRLASRERWVPADPDAALLSIVDAGTLASLREVAEVKAR